jgi:hypothetical protein
MNLEIGTCFIHLMKLHHLMIHFFSLVNNLMENNAQTLIGSAT